VLYHFTDREAAAAVLSAGFRHGEEGGVWLTRHLDAWGERARSALLEVRLDMTEDELKVFRQKAVADEKRDHEAGDFVKATDPAEVERMLWHAIPAEIVNARATVRLIPDNERHHLMVFGVDSDE